MFEFEYELVVMLFFQYSRKKIFCLSAIFVFLASCQMSESVIQSNVGLNGGFEHVKNGLPINWYVYNQNQSEFKITFDTVVFKRGKQSIKFDVKKCTGEKGRFSPGMTQELKVTPNQTYQISCWIKNEGATFDFNVRSVNEKNAVLAKNWTHSMLNNEWNELTFTYQIPQDMNKIQLELNILKPGLVWIDEVKVEKSK